MKRTLLISTVIVIIVVAIIAVVVSQNKSNETAAKHAVATNQVQIQNYMFSPETITIKKGTTVTWTNNDEAHHEIASYDGRMPTSPSLGKGESYHYTFTKKGTYKYHCVPHPNMKAIVIVTD